ncbi:hypothetical protein BJX96DRAFT_182645 [Aspergillus floccosus]
MTEIRNPLEQKYMCTAEECAKEFTSIDDWRTHVEDYSFEKGHICLYDDCGELISTRSNESLAHRSHLYIKHRVEPRYTEELAKSFIAKNFYSVGEGRIWCSQCRELLRLNNRAEVLDHFQRHIRGGSKIKIPGQTKYPAITRARKEEVGTPARSADEGADCVIDLSRRGTMPLCVLNRLNGCLCYIRTSRSRLRPRSERLPVSNADEHLNDQLTLYRTLTQATDLPYACPLCLRGYNRYDSLYNHFRSTQEAEHRDLKALWFGSKCPVCSETSDHILRHTAKRHPTIYQSLMKSTLRIRPEVVTEIPASPECFKHTFLFPLRRPDCVVRLPPRKQIRKSRIREDVSMAQGSSRRGTTRLKKRKAEHQNPQQDIDDHLDARMEDVAPPSHTSGLPGHRVVQVDAAHPPSVASPIGYDFYTESNPVQSALACPTHSLSFPSLAPLPHDVHEPRIDLSARGYMSHLSTEYQVPWEMFVPTDIHQGDTGDGGQVTRN